MSRQERLLEEQAGQDLALLRSTQRALVSLHEFVVAELDSDPGDLVDYLTAPDEQAAAVAAVDTVKRLRRLDEWRARRAAGGSVPVPAPQEPQ